MKFIGKVKVYIGHLIALKAQKRFKRNIVAVAVKVRAAFRALFFGQVKARAYLAVQEKLAVPALGANIVRRQRVDFGNTRHGSGKGRSYRTTRAN